MYFHQMQNFLFKGRIIGNKVDKKHFNWYLFSMECFVSRVLLIIDPDVRFGAFIKMAV